MLTRLKNARQSRNPDTATELMKTDAINRLLAEMDEFGPDSQEYALRLEQLKELTKLQRRRGLAAVSPDAALAAGANLLGIGIIVAYEQHHVLTSFATKLLNKGK